MISRSYTIIDPLGMHARPATALLKLSRQFKSEFSLKKDDRTIKLNSMLNILTLAIRHGETLCVDIDGADENEAAHAFDIFFTEEMKKF